MIAVFRTISLLHIDCTSSKSVLLLALSNETFRTKAFSVMLKSIGFPNRFHALVSMIMNATAIVIIEIKIIFLSTPNCLTPEKLSNQCYIKHYDLIHNLTICTTQRQKRTRFVAHKLAILLSRPEKAKKAEKSSKFHFQ